MAKNTQPAKNFDVRFDSELQAEIQARSFDGASIPLTARDMLESYIYLLKAELGSLKNLFSVSEFSLILDACNGWFVQKETLHLLWAEVEDSLRAGLAEKWGVDGPKLVKKLRGLSYAQNAALLDAVKRWWKNLEREMSKEGFEAVGVVCQR